MRCVNLSWIILSVGFFLDAVNAQEPSISAAIAALRSPQESVRIEAIDTLGRIRADTDEAIEALAELTKDNSALTRAHAAFALSRIGEKARPAIPRIVSLANDPDVRVRRAGVLAIKHIRPGPEVSVPLLLTMMADSDSAVRLRATDAMADLGQAAVPQLILQLEHEDVRLPVVLALNQIGPAAQEAIPALVGLVKDAKAPAEIRREAIMAIGEMGEAAAGAVSLLALALDEDSLRSAAVYSLGNLGPVAQGAKPNLRSLLEGDDPFVRTISAWALIRIAPGDPGLIREASLVLANSLKSDNERVREAAAHSLAKLDLDSEIMASVMETALKDADEATVTAAVDTLARLGEAGVPKLVEALRYESSRAKAIRILRKMGPQALPALDALVDLLKVDDREVQREVMFALGDMEAAAKDAVPALMEVLKRSDNRLRYAAVYALGRIGPEAIAGKPLVVQLLGSEDDFLAISAAWALARIDPKCELTSPQSVPLFVAGLTDPNARVRMESAASLRCLGPLAQPAVDKLKQALNDENAFVRDMAAEALKAIRGELTPETSAAPPSTTPPSATLPSATPPSATPPPPPRAPQS